MGCREGWLHDRTVFPSSAVQDWQLVCGRAGLRATAQAIFMVGVLVGKRKHYKMV